MGHRVPLTLVAYAGLTLAPFVVAVARGEWNAAITATAVLVAVLLIFLLRGSRVAWWCAVALEFAHLVANVVDPPPWWTCALSVLAFATLIAPPTRRYVREAPTGRAR